MRILTIHGDILLQAPCSQLLNIIGEEIVHRDCNDTEEGFFWVFRTVSDQDALQSAYCNLHGRTQMAPSPHLK